MCYQINGETIVTMAALIVAVVAIYYSNKNTRQQIRTEKLERLYQAIQTLSRYYGLFMEFWFKIQQQKDSNDKEIETLEQYYKLRDQKITTDERRNIEDLLSRITVLTECYTKKNLKKKIKNYEKLMYSFFELVVQGGSIQQEIHFKNGYPDYDRFFAMTKSIQDDIVREIKL
jgi:hypothetical protein